jgi:hypothetical protein
LSAKTTYRRHDAEKTHGRVSLLGLTGLLGEDDQSAPILLQPSDIDLLALLTSCLPPVINDDTQTLGFLSGDTGLLDFGQGESSTEPDLGVVSDRRSSDGGSEELERSDTQGQGLGLSGGSSPVLSSGLVEPGLDPFL